jgi:hypothetical protein
MFFGILFAFFVAVLNWIIDKLTGLPFPVCDGATDHVRDGAAAVPDLFGAGHDLHRHRSSDGRRRDGRYRAHLILGAAKRRLSWDLVRQATGSTAKLSAFVVSSSWSGPCVFSLTFWRQRSRLGRTPVDLAAGQPDRLSPFSSTHLSSCSRLLPRFLRIGLHRHSAAWAGREHLGIDLIWFGVILGVNMQTSFMHPPFGFALFYLRSVAPKDSYIDRVTGKRMDAVTTGQIYWGAVPFVVIQVIMVLLVIMFPAMVMHYKGALSTIDPNTIKIDIPQFEQPPLDFGPPPKQ